ncbi:putative Ig domain-containing protein [Brucella intermedia]|nr:putative Ig domain-containing protein [Brucella intermedia]
MTISEEYEGTSGYARVRGTPTAAGNYEIRYAPAIGITSTSPVLYILRHFINVAPRDVATITINPTSLPSGKTGKAYTSQTIAASGGIAPYTYKSSGTLPPGLTINPSTGVFSGTPTSAGTYTFWLGANDNNGDGGEATGTNGWRQYTVTISDPATITVSPANLPSGKVGQYRYDSLSASGGQWPYDFKSSGTLPPGLTVNGGVFAGTPTATGTYTFTISATDANGDVGSQQYTVVIETPTITINPANPTLPSGKVGRPFSQQISASGGKEPYEYKVWDATKIPPGLTFNAQSRLLSGTPTAAGNYTFWLGATDANGYGGGDRGENGWREYTVTIAAAPTITVGPGYIPDSKVGQSYDVPFEGTGGTKPYTYRVSTGLLPDGLALDRNTGRLTGVLTRAGEYHFTIEAKDNEGYLGTRASLIKVATAPTVELNLSALPGGKVGLDYGSHTLAATGGTAPYSYVVTGLPAGVTASGDTISGKPTAAGSFDVTVTATDAEGYTVTKSQTVVIAPAPTVDLDLSVLPGGKVGLDYGSHTLAATGGTAPYSYVVTGLPAGVTASGDTISGTPTKDGSFAVEVTATDAEGYVVTKSQTVLIARPDIQLDLDNIPSGKVGRDYGSHSLAAIGGIAPYKYSITGLPAGLTLAEDTISGTPSAAGSFHIEVTTTDASGYSMIKGGTLVIVAAPTIVVAPDTLPSGKVGLEYGSHKFSATGGTAPYTYEISSLPAGLSFDGINTISGTPTESTNYGIWVTVKDAEGYIKYKNYTVFIAPAPTVDLDLSVLPGGKVGLDYGSHTLAATGGTAPYSYVVTGLPAGVTASGDTISGKPTAAGSFDVTVTATDAEGYTVTKSQTVVIAPAPTVDLDLSALPGGKVGLDYGSHKLAATGGTAPYTYVVSGLPAGLTFDGTDTISGKPTAAGSFDVHVTATDAEGYAVAKTQEIVIADAPVIDVDLSALPGGKVGLDYGSHKLAATGGTEPYTYVVSGLPDGLTFDGADTISGTPTAAGSFDVHVTATDAEGYSVAKTQEIVIADAPVIDVDLSALPGGKVGLDYGSHKLAATGGTAPYTYVVTGLPDGLTFDGTDTISGKPTAAGSFDIHVTATDAEGYAVAKTQEIVIADAPVIDVDLSALPGGKVGLDYGSHKLAATGGTEPYTYDVTGLPDGLTFDGTDTISGKPTAAGSFDIHVTATDAEGSTITQTQTVVVEAAPTIELVALPDAEQGKNYGPHQLQASGGTGPYSYVITGLPAGLTFVGNTLAGTPTTAGTFPVSVTVTDADGYAVTHVVTFVVRVPVLPDPSLDPEVIGLVNAQVQTANRMAKMQIRNFGQRLEQLHAEGDCRQDSLGLSIGLDGAQLNPKMPQVCSGRELSLWTAGEVNMGKSSSDDHAKDRKLDHISIGVSGGVDYRFSPSFTGGIGFGYGKDTTDIGQNGTKSRATMTSLAAYGSYHPSNNFFLDGVIGYGWLNFESDRFVTATGGMASGERKGQQVFGSVTLGYDYRNEAWLLSPYVRADAAHTKLSGFSETGAGIYNLTYGDQTADLLSATIGLRGEYAIPMSWGELKPKARLEYSHDFEGSSKVKLGYTDIGGMLPYAIDKTSTSKDNLKIEVGFDAKINGDWTAGLDYSTQIGTGGGKLEHGLRWKLSKKF